MEYPIFQGIFLKLKGGGIPFNKEVGAPDCSGFNTTDMQNSAGFEFGLTGGFLWQSHRPKDQPTSQEGIDPRLGEAALRAPAASREDSFPQAILKFHHPSSLDYRACQGLLVNFFLIQKLGTQRQL